MHMAATAVFTVVNDFITVWIFRFYIYRNAASADALFII